MLPQLVGMSCAVCNQRVGSEIDGRFCEGCGNPIHNACGPPPQQVSNDELLTAHEQPKCPRCGSDPTTPVACQVRRITLGQRLATEVAPFREAAALYNWWKFLGGLGVIVGAIAILFGIGLLFATPDPTRPNSEAENRFFGYFGVTFGLVLVSGGAFFAWYQTRAARRYQEAGDEQDEPPE